MANADSVAFYRSRAEDTATLLSILSGGVSVKAFVLFIALPQAFRLVEEYGIPPHESIELPLGTDLLKWLRDQHSSESSLGGDCVPLEHENHSEGFLCMLFAGDRSPASAQPDAFEAFQCSEAGRLADMRHVIELDQEMEFVREMFRALFDRLQQPAVIINRQSGQIQQANPAFEALVSLSPVEIIGKSLWRLGAFSGEWSFQRAIEESAREKRPVLIRAAARFHMPTILGIWASFVDPETVCVTLADFSEQINLRNRLLEAEKRGAIFDLFRRIVHDLNNPLTAIRGFAQLMSTRASSPDDVKRDAFLIISQARRCNEILGQVRTMAQSTQRLNTKFDLNNLVTMSVGLHKIEAESRGVDIITSLSENLPAVTGNYYSVQSTLDEVVLNALESFREAGKTGIIQIATRRENEHVLLVVEDEAGGAPEPEKVFQPFYTTRRDPGHAGLGLTMVKTIAQEIGGEVDFRNTEKGSWFCLQLPISAP